MGLNSSQPTKVADTNYAKVAETKDYYVTMTDIGQSDKYKQITIIYYDEQYYNELFLHQGNNDYDKIYNKIVESRGKILHYITNEHNGIIDVTSDNRVISNKITFIAKLDISIEYKRYCKKYALYSVIIHDNDNVKTRMFTIVTMDIELGKEYTCKARFIPILNEQCVYEAALSNTDVCLDKSTSA